jgi:hypothetical protein
MRSPILLLPALLALSLPAAAQKAPADEPPAFASDLVLEPGQTALVATGPVRQVLCDAAGIVELVSTDQGNAFRALAVGETVCTLVTADSVRRTYRVKVTRRRG